MDGPRRIAVRELSFAVTGPDGPDKETLAFPRYYHEIIADGTRYYAMDAHQQRYLLRPLHPKGFAAESPGAGLFSDYTWGEIILRGGREYVKDAKSTGRYLGAELIDGLRCDKIQTRSNGTIYWIGQNDRFIRRVEANIGHPMHLIESYTIHQIGGVIPSSEFAITVPSGVRRVDEF